MMDFKKMLAAQNVIDEKVKKNWKTPLSDRELLTHTIVALDTELSEVNRKRN